MTIRQGSCGWGHHPRACPWGMGGKNETGTSTLEVMGMAPLVALLLMILIQSAVTLYGVTTAQTAARQGARALSQGEQPYSVVRDSVPGWMDVDTTTFGPGSGVKVVVDVPDLIPAMNLTITRKSVMPGSGS